LVESEFNVSNEWDLDIFFSINLGVTGFGAGTLGKSAIDLLDEALGDFWDGSFSADSVFNLVKRNHGNIFNGWGLLVKSEFNVSNEWDLDIFFSVNLGVTSFGAGTLGKSAIDLLDEALGEFWDLSFSADSEFNLVKRNHGNVFNFRFVEKSNLDFSDDWDFDVFLSISNGESLVGTCSFFKGGEIFGVFLVFLVNDGLSAQVLG